MTVKGHRLFFASESVWIWIGYKVHDQLNHCIFFLGLDCAIIKVKIKYFDTLHLNPG